MTQSLYGTAFDSATFFAGSLLLKSPMPTNSLATCSLLNALSVQGIHYLGKPDQQTAQVIAGIALGTLLVNLFAKSLASRTTIVINQIAALQLAGFHLVIKTAATATYQLALAHYEKLRYGTFGSIEDFKKLTPADTGRSKAYFEKHPSVWDTLSFKEQAAFNLSLQENTLPPLDFTKCSKETTLSDQELAVFLSSLDETTLTDNQFEVLKAHNNPKLYHQFFSNADVDLSAPHQTYFAKIFYDHSLPLPFDTFLPPLSVPTSEKSVDTVQASYYCSYYDCYPTKFDSHSLNEQVLLNKILSKGGSPRVLREPEPGEIDSLSTDALEYYRDFFKSDSSKWQAKGNTYQSTFNAALKDQGMDLLTIPEKPMPTWQKVGIAAFGCLFLLTVGYAIASSRTRTHQLDKLPPQPEDSPDQQPETIQLEEQQTAGPAIDGSRKHTPQLDTSPSQPDASLDPHTDTIQLEEQTHPLSVCEQNDLSQIDNSTFANASSTPLNPLSASDYIDAFKFPQEKFKIDLSRFIPKSYEPTPPNRAVSLLYPSLESRHAVCTRNEESPITHQEFSHQVYTPYQPFPSYSSHRITSTALVIPQQQPLSHELPKDGSGANSKWLVVPLVGALFFWLFPCQKKKTADQARIEEYQEENLPEVDRGGFVDLRHEEEAFVWDAEKASKISLGEKFVRILIPKALADKDVKVTFNTSRSSNNGLSKISQTLKYLGKNRWEQVAQAVTFVAFDLIEVRYGKPRSIDFKITEDQGEVKLDIDTTVAEDTYKANIVFESRDMLSKLTPKEFKVS